MSGGLFGHKNHRHDTKLQALAHRQIAGLSYDQAAARLGCEPDWPVRVETGFAAAAPEKVAAFSRNTGCAGPGPPTR